MTLLVLYASGKTRKDLFGSLRWYKGKRLRKRLPRLYAAILELQADSLRQKSAAKGERTFRQGALNARLLRHAWQAGAYPRVLETLGAAGLDALIHRLDDTVRRPERKGPESF